MQVEVIRTYTARQPDELSLQVADVVLVSQTVEDGAFAHLKYSSHVPPFIHLTQTLHTCLKMCSQIYTNTQELKVISLLR